MIFVKMNDYNIFEWEPKKIMCTLAKRKEIYDRNLFEPRESFVEAATLDPAGPRGTCPLTSSLSSRPA